MPPSRTKTVKNKHSGSKSGVSGSKASKSSGPPDGVVRKRSTGAKTPTTTAKQVKGRSAASMLNKKKKKVYTEKELGLPQLNMITPIGVTKPKGKKKGKVFVDDRVRLLHPSSTPVSCKKDLMLTCSWSLTTGEHVHDSRPRPGRQGWPD